MLIATGVSPYTSSKSSEEQAQTASDTRQGLLKLVGISMHPISNQGLAL